MEDPNWISGRDLLPLFKDIENAKGIEIGIDEGNTSLFFLENHPNLTLLGIDPYAEYDDWYPGGHWDKAKCEYKKKLAYEKLTKFIPRWSHFAMTSDDAVNLIQDNSYDFIFIDGLHEFDQVYKDCANYFPKIKKGGIFAGHDYKGVEGVGRAVNKFASEKNATVIYLPDNDVWYWIKN